MTAKRKPSSGIVILVGGPHDGHRMSGILLRGGCRCEGGEYKYVLGQGDEMCRYWLEDPVIVELPSANG